MPSLEDLERQIRRQPIGRRFSDICLDLAAVPGFCHPALWNTMFEIMTYFGSSVNKLMQEKPAAALHSTRSSTAGAAPTGTG